MKRWADFSVLDTQPIQDGDSFFTGVNSKLDRGKLPPGVLARAANNRCRRGFCEPRGGMQLAGEFNAPYTNPIIGSEVYGAPNTSQMLLVAELNSAFIWALAFGKSPIKINLPALETTGLVHVEFVQAFDKVLLLRWDGSLPLVWDGDVTHAFTALPAPTAPSVNIPSRRNGVPFQGRVLLYNSLWPNQPIGSQFLQSDDLEYHQYDNILGVFSVNAGQGDFILSVLPFYQDSVLVFKTTGIHQVSQFAIDPFLTTQRVVNSQINCVGIHFPLPVGADIIFLARPGGLYRVTQVDQDRTVSAPVAISDPIEHTIKRIWWEETMFWGCSALLGDYAFFGVVLDRNEIDGCNAILPYNIAQNQWESESDSWLDLAFRFNRLHVLDYNGQPRLLAVDNRAMAVYLMYEGIEDVTVATRQPVPHVIETRGYCSDGTPKKFGAWRLPIRTYAAEVNVTAITEGVNEEKLLTTDPITKNNRAYYPFGSDPYDPLTGDPNAPLREDYSPLGELVDDAGEDFEDLPIGDLEVVPGTALPELTEQLQDSLEGGSVRTTGRWLSIRIENNRGQCQILGVEVDAIPARNSLKTVA